MLLNILNNAVDAHIRNKTVQPIISISLSREGGCLLEIAASGEAGISLFMARHTDH